MPNRLKFVGGRGGGRYYADKSLQEGGGGGGGGEGGMYHWYWLGPAAYVLDPSHIGLFAGYNNSPLCYVISYIDIRLSRLCWMTSFYLGF